ncbi:MAG: citrate lyase acyl carrier protein [Treponema sp.]|nr:citrate lyase acyl carrier protein [Treponema sp.]
MEIRKPSVAGTMESSDVMISIEPGEKGIELELESIVEKQFGREIRRTILETLQSLDVRNGKIRAVDKGALDCTLRARVKTAVYRADGRTVHDWRV